MSNTTSNLSDLIPIVGHYDNSTLVTKNSELVQIIHLKGYSKRFNKSHDINLREIVRGVLNELIQDNFMFYIYVRRDFTNIDNSLQFNSTFAEMVHKIWVKEYDLNHCLMNSIYIAIVYRGAQDALNIKNILHRISKKSMQKFVKAKLENGLQEISNLSIKLLEKLEPYGVRLLSIIHKEQKLISEPLSFIYYLTHLSYKEVEIAQIDYSELLANNLNIDTEYNQAIFNTIDDIALINTQNNNSSIYTAVLSFKYQYNLDIEYTDQILSLNQQMFITESIRMANSQAYLKELKQYKKIYSASTMQSSLEVIEKLIKDVEDLGCFKTQTSITILANSESILYDNLLNTKNILSNLGLSIVREDYYMMGALISNIPGNAHLLRRENYTTSAKISLFTSIKQKALGGYNGSIWGKPITIFKSSDKLPYFFNFHNEKDIGNIMIVGQPVTHAYILKYFLICESLKFDIQVINFFNTLDEVKISELVCGASIDAFSLNLIEIMNSDPSTILLLLNQMLNLGLNTMDELAQNTLKKIERIIDILQKNQNIDEIHEIINSQESIINTNIQTQLLNFFTQDIFFKFFNTNEIINEKYSNINLNDAFKKIPDNLKLQMQSTLMFLYLKQLNSQLYSTNTKHIIISVDINCLGVGALQLGELIAILQDLSKKHVVIMIYCNDRRDLYKIPELKQIIQKAIPTQFFLSDKFVDSAFKEIFDLTHNDLDKIKMYNPSEHMFLLKQNNRSIISSFNILSSLG